MNNPDVSKLVVSTDRNLLNLDLVMDYLTKAYWHTESTSEQISNAIRHSLCFGLYDDGQQIGFARVVTDYTFSAWLADVFILPDYQRKGYGRFFMQRVFDDPQLVSVKRWRLATKDAHDFYAQFGFAIISNHDRLMAR